MPTKTAILNAELWDKLISAHERYTFEVSPFYDDVLRDVAAGIERSGSPLCDHGVISDVVAAGWR